MFMRQDGLHRCIPHCKQALNRSSEPTSEAFTDILEKGSGKHYCRLRPRLRLQPCPRQSLRKPDSYSCDNVCTAACDQNGEVALLDDPPAKLVVVEREG